VKVVLDIGVLGVLVLMMGAVGMELERQHFRAVAERKGMLLLTLAAQAAILPALGFGLTCILALPPHVSAGILLLGACPVGDIANVYTLLARANVALSVTVNAVSLLLSVGTMAMVFEAYDYLLGVPFAFAVPTPVLLGRLLLMLVLPLLAGMAVRCVSPGVVATHAKSVHRASLAGIACLLLYVMVTQREQLAAEWRQTAVVAAAFMGLALMVGLAFGRLLRLSKEDGVTIGIGFAVRNVALASAIAITLLNRIEYAVFAVVYFLTEVPLLLGAVAVYRAWGTLAVQQPSLPRNPR
jgi:BASS family bile acid:Na+ symporter